MKFTEVFKIIASSSIVLYGTGGVLYASTSGNGSNVWFYSFMWVMGVIALALELSSLGGKE